jgi:hypothetical protein
VREHEVVVAHRPVTDLEENKAVTGLHRTTGEDRWETDRWSAEPQLLENLGKIDIERTIDDQTEGTFVDGVGSEKNDRALEVRVSKGRHRDKELAYEGGGSGH